MAEDRVLHALLGRDIPASCPLGHPPGSEDLFDDVDYLMSIPEKAFCHKISFERQIKMGKLARLRCQGV